MGYYYLLRKKNMNILLSTCITCFINVVVTIDIFRSLKKIDVDKLLSDI